MKFDSPAEIKVMKSIDFWLKVELWIAKKECQIITGVAAAEVSALQKLKQLFDKVKKIGS